MDHYIDIRLRPDPEFSPDTLLNALYVKLHRALVQHGQGDIGISFPDVRDAQMALGERLRLHGGMTTLQLFMEGAWLSGMREHVSTGQITQTPAHAKHRVVRRVQAKSNVERQRRRHMKRHGLSEEQARERIPDSAAQRLRLPCVQLNSTSTDQSFPLFIQHGELREQAQPGAFNSYGLSATATVPWF
jgi:CRISPR-associated endonuclease Csy4